MSVAPPLTAPSPSVGGRFRLRLAARRDLELVAGRPRVMGILNLTPDSFSDGGAFERPERAIERAIELVAEGADLLDLGAESTRPGGGVYGDGAREVPADEELARLLPVLEGLRPLTDVPISVDTRKAEVARAALAAGADLVNDVSALTDPEMGGVIAAAGCPVVLMHSRGELATMQSTIAFSNLIEEVASELALALDRAAKAGIEADQVVLDPGLGFGKSAEQNLELLRELGRFARLERPILVGASRKSFLGRLTGAAPSERLPESLAAAGAAARGGAAIVRVHDVGATRRFLTAWTALAEAGGAR